MSAPSRKQRLESLLRREIAGFVQTQLRDPRIGFVTITRVEMSNDLQHCTAFYSVMGDDMVRRQTARALSGAKGPIQRAYAPQLKMRRMPLLHFAFDQQEAKRQVMDDLIRQARSSDPDPSPEPPAADPAAEQNPDDMDWLDSGGDAAQP